MAASLHKWREILVFLGNQAENSVGFWEVFWILGSVFGFWEVFWILGSVLDSGKCFVPMGHHILKTKITIPGKLNTRFLFYKYTRYLQTSPLTTFKNSKVACSRSHQNFLVSSCSLLEGAKDVFMQRAFLKAFQNSVIPSYMLKDSRLSSWDLGNEAG